MPSLTADTGMFSLTGEPVGAAMYAGTAMLRLLGQTVSFGRTYDASFDSLGATKLERLLSSNAIVDSVGRPTAQFQRFWQKHCEAIETAFRNFQGQLDAINAAYNAAAQANTAASNANNAVATVTATVADAQDTLDQIQTGDLNLPSITIGGSKFVNNAGDLVVAP